MITRRDEAEKKAALDVAGLMITAARTAPKGHGLDNIETLILSDDDKGPIMKEMKRVAEETGADFFRRDAENINNSHCLVLIGIKNDPINLENCGFCGFKNCTETRKAGANCAFNVTDLGIAIGSAVSIAADHRIDNRVFFSAGKAALNLGLMPDDVRVCYGIPLSTHGKSIYYDRG